MKKFSSLSALSLFLFSLQPLWADLPECGKAAPSKACQITFDRTAPVSGKSVTVENETQVTVVLIKKSVFESCKNDVKREELPDISPLPTLISLIKDLAGPLMLGAAPAKVAAPLKPEESIAQKLHDIATFADAQANIADSLNTDYKAGNEKLNAFFRTKYMRAKYAVPLPVKKDTDFEADRAARQTAAEALTAKVLPNTAGGELTYKAVVAEFSAYVKSPASDPATIRLLEEGINRARTALDTLAKAVSTLEAARTRMLATVDYLKSLKDPEFESTATILPDRNAKVSGSFGCTSDISGKPTLDPPIVYTVIFRNTPRLSLSAGILLSTIPRNSVAIESVADGTAAGIVTAHSEIRDHPFKPQAVPFSFMNLRIGQPQRLAGRNMTFNLAPGAGVNPNNGGSSAEFFMGLSLGIGDFFVGAGSHIGHELRPANGYRLLDRPPADLKAVPTETPWKYGFGVTVSYRIPLK